MVGIIYFKNLNTFIPNIIHYVRIPKIFPTMKMHFKSGCIFTFYIKT